MRVLLQSKQKTRSHSFPSMNWQKRQFIHELSEHFGCESVAYDAEPNRNVVATADKEKVTTYYNSPASIHSRVWAQFI